MRLRRVVKGKSEWWKAGGNSQPEIVRERGPAIGELEPLGERSERAGCAELGPDEDLVFVEDRRRTAERERRPCEEEVEAAKGAECVVAVPREVQAALSGGSPEEPTAKSGQEKRSSQRLLFLEQKTLLREGTQKQEYEATTLPPASPVQIVGVQLESSLLQRRTTMAFLKRRRRRMAMAILKRSLQVARNNQHARALSLPPADSPAVAPSEAVGPKPSENPLPMSSQKDPDSAPACPLHPLKNPMAVRKSKRRSHKRHEEIKQGHVGVCDLTGDDVVAGEAAVAKEEEASSTTVWYPEGAGAVELHEVELLALAPLTDLNGSVINFYIRHLVHLGRVPPCFLVADTFFYAKLCQVAASPSPAGAARDLRSLLAYLGAADLFALNAIAIPVHATGHWSLAVVCHPGLLQPLLPGKKKAAQPPAPFILHLDSLHKTRGGHDTAEVVGRLSRFLKDVWRERERSRVLAVGGTIPKQWSLPELRERRVQVPQQDNSSDCGLLLLLNLERFLAVAPNVIRFAEVDTIFRGHDYLLSEALKLRGQLLQLAWQVFRNQHGGQWQPTVSAVTGDALGMKCEVPTSAEPRGEGSTTC